MSPEQLAEITGGTTGMDVIDPAELAETYWRLFTDPTRTEYRFLPRTGRALTPAIALRYARLGANNAGTTVPARGAMAAVRGATPEPAGEAEGRRRGIRSHMVCVPDYFPPRVARTFPWNRLRMLTGCSKPLAPGAGWFSNSEHSAAVVKPTPGSADHGGPGTTEACRGSADAARGAGPGGIS
jgi:hypothetical protein